MKGFTLPIFYHDGDIEKTEDYLSDVIRLLDKFSWIYDFQLTRFATECAWKKIPHQWVDVLTSLTNEELNMLPFDKPRESWPSSLQEFLTSARRLSPTRDVSTSFKSVSLDNTMKMGMVPKKCHEVSQMSGLVKDICETCSCSLVLDVGAGLGYLSATLARISGLHVLALECKEMLSHGTEERGLQQRLPGTLEALTFQLQDTRKSFQQLQSLLKEKMLPVHKASSGLEPHLHSSCPSNTMNCKHIENCDNDMICSSCNNKTHTQLARYPQSQGSASMMTDISCGSATADLTSGARELATATVLSRPNVGDRFLGHFAATVAVGDNTLVSECTADCQNPNMIESSCAFCNTSGAVCMVGLHCCGSLTPMMLKLFLDTPEVHALVCVSCCYHGIQQADDANWKHFPLSKAVKEALHKNSDWYPSIYAFRLAAQETRARWVKQTEAEHMHHMRHVGFRAILELFCEKEKIVLNKEKRRLVRKKDMDNFESYTTAVLNRTNILEECPQARGKLQQLYQDNMHIFPFIEPFTALQVCLQPVLERLILVDRVLFLREAATNATLLPVFNEALSPRNIAIVATKEN